MALISHLFLKPQRGADMVPQRSLSFLSGVGIMGDVNADSLSPRQVLVIEQQWLEALQTNAGKLRENIVVAGLPEAIKPGSVVRLGDTVELQTTFLCEPCSKIAHLVGGNLKKVVGRRGVLGIVTVGGTVKIGSPVYVYETSLPTIPEDVLGRLIWILCRIPRGRVVTYSRLTVFLGVSKSFSRALPTYLRKALQVDCSLPVHRVINGDGRPDCSPHQYQMLLTDGVTIQNGVVDLKKSELNTNLFLRYWNDQAITNCS